MAEQQRTPPLQEAAPIHAATLGNLLLRAARETAQLRIQTAEDAPHPDTLWLNTHEQARLNRSAVDSLLLAWPDADNVQIPRDQFIHGTLQLHPTIRALRALALTNSLAATYESFTMKAMWWTSLSLWHVPEYTNQSTPHYRSLLAHIHDGDDVLRAHTTDQHTLAAHAQQQLHSLPSTIIEFYSSSQTVYALFADDPELVHEFVLSRADSARLPSETQLRGRGHRGPRGYGTPRPDNLPAHRSGRQPAEVPTVSAA
ncbi:MAG TPA: hypothetical protein VFN56_03885 [Candidatus Saccharimonadales bacterium]|nr:hypothetical protein [Candidatus Saccharimonadales bacterium]